MTQLEIYQSQVKQLLQQKGVFQITLRDNMTARSRSGRRARRNAEQQLKRIDRQLDDVNKKILQLSRVENRTERVEDKQDTKKVAYQHGIDPNKALMDSISSLGKSASGVFGGRGNAQNQEIQQRTEKQNNIFIYGGLIALFLFIFKKK